MSDEFLAAAAALYWLPYRLWLCERLDTLPL